MEAKDTVMNDKAMVQTITDNPTVPMGQALIERQAEISFKVGEAQGIQKGRREVVKWVEENSATFELMNDRCFGQDEWQAFLKSKGILLASDMTELKNGGVG